MMRIWCISDTHGRHNELVIPENLDLIIHCGDCSSHSDIRTNSIECSLFFDWFNKIDVAKILVPGNHDTSLEQWKYLLKEQFNGISLINESINFNGINIYGSPYTPAFGKSWAFMRNRNKMHDIWQMIPENIDILITHGPPFGVLDLANNIQSGQKIAQVGCKSLLKKVLKIKPKINVFGHIHSTKELNNYGLRQFEEITFINCACCTHYDKFYNGVLIDYNRLFGE